MINLNIGILADSKIYNHSSEENNRKNIIIVLNSEEFDNIIITDHVNICEYDLIGVNHMIFMRNLYSQYSEDQTIDNLFYKHIINIRLNI